MPSVVALVGAAYEENLSLRYLAAAIGQAGFRAELVPFADDARAGEVAERILALGPLVVGLSLPFQLRARQLLAVATELRTRGYRGHVCVGGHFATFEYDNLLRDFPAVDSVVRHEGEDTFRELCMMVRDRQTPGPIPGLMLSQDGARLRWRLPREAGLYQAEVVIDYGASGLSFDTLALEVS